MSMHYILEGHEPKSVDVMTWAKWFESASRTVAQDTIGDVRVSTVFLGIDHSFGHPSDGPALFETMIFGGPHDEYQERCGTWAEAEAQHAEALALVRGSVNG